MGNKPYRTHHQTLATAYHEAGHIVVGYELGFRLGKGGVSIVSNGESAGRADIPYGSRFTPDIYDSKRVRQRVERYVMVNFAGEVAQRKFSPRSVFPNGASEDLYETVDNLSRFYDPQTVETRMKALEIQTRELVHSPTIWSKIVAVATTLHERQQMNRHEVEHVIRSTVALILNES